MRLVLDTCVIVAAMRSPKGASARLVAHVLEGQVEMIASVAVFLEYESVMRRAEHLAVAGWRISDVDLALSALAGCVSPIHGVWRLRPQLPDPDDEMVLEAAVNGGAEAIVTFETATFQAACARFGVAVMTPAQVCAKIK